MVDDLSSRLGLQFRLQSGGRKSFFMAASVLWTLDTGSGRDGNPARRAQILDFMFSLTMPARSDIFASFFAAVLWIFK